MLGNEAAHVFRNAEHGVVSQALGSKQEIFFHRLGVDVLFDLDISLHAGALGHVPWILIGLSQRGSKQVLAETSSQ
ncbi:hypothetical protein [Xanthomonas oryzae]|uniref:hypothetical protein n=1 Tax=Xanthomonas oryzae TaxID=347 RepID=UPI0006AC9F5D|nr:hypothetical protein [Xanthomonas oryzae]